MSSAENVNRWRQRTKERMVQSMGGKCQCCGYDRTNRALAFHHIDPTVKEIGFGDTRANPRNWPSIVDELRKCVLVCHNCHAEIHAGIRDVPTKYESFDESFVDYREIAEYDACPICSKPKPASQKFCCHACAQKNSRKVDWDSIDLLDLLKRHTIRELETMLGVSNAAIYKRRDKILQCK